MGADVVETALQLCFLLVFALAAAGYVMKTLLRNGLRLDVRGKVGGNGRVSAWEG